YCDIYSTTAPPHTHTYTLSLHDALPIYKYWKLKIDQATNTGLAPPDSELLNYFRITEAGPDMFLSLHTDLLTKGISDENNSDTMSKEKIDPTKNKDRPEFIGSAAFKNGKMIGKLSGEETRTALMLNKTFPRKEFIANFEDPFNKKYNMAIKVIKYSNAKTTMNLKKNPEQIHVKVPMLIETLTKHSMQKLVKKTQKEFKAQPFGWSLEARKQFPTIQQYNQFNWAKKYPKMDVSFDVEVTISDYGRQKSVPRYKEIHK